MGQRRAAAIVIPLRAQRDEWLEQCVRSAIEQTVPTTVLVVTSPHTPDSNLRILEALSRGCSDLEYFERPAGAQFAGAINAGWQRADSDRVGLLLSDDWLSPDAVEQCLKHDADIVSTGHIGYREDGETVLWRRECQQAIFDTLPTAEQRAAYVTHFFLFRRQAVLAAGGVDPGIGHVGADDYDLPWTMLERGASVACTGVALYHVRDHDHTRLTLRPHAQQVDDLRKIFKKHRALGPEGERLIAQKVRWLGVPWHVARDHPDWYQEQPEQAHVPDVVHATLKESGYAVAHVEKLSTQGAASTLRSCFRVQTSDGRSLKVRVVESPDRADQVARFRGLLEGLPMPRVISTTGRVCIEEWLEGAPFQSAAAGRGCILNPDLVEAGRLLGRIAASACHLEEVERSPRKPDSMLLRLGGFLATLESASLLDRDATLVLAKLAEGNAPSSLDIGIVHLDFAPDNLLLTAAGVAVIDNESLQVGALDLDLARTWYRWPMRSIDQAAFLDGYSQYRSPSSFFRHELFWAIFVLAAGVDYQLRIGASPAIQVERLKRLAAGELPNPWMPMPGSHDTRVRGIAGGSGKTATRRLRIGFICDYLAIGGQERAILNLLEGVDTSRFEAYLYAFRGGEFTSAARRIGVPVVLGSSASPYAWKKDWTAKDRQEKRVWRRTLADALGRDQIDAVIISAWPDAIDSARSAGVRVLIERLDGPKLVGKLPDKSALDRVVCESATIRNQVLDLSIGLQLDPQRVELIYPGVDLDRFSRSRHDRDSARRQLGIDDTDIAIGYVGRLAPGKGLDLLIQAFGRLCAESKRPSLRLFIVGPDDGMLHALRPLARRLDLDRQVSFLPPADDVASVLAGVDIFATATEGEGIPNALLEAMAMELPIVATNVGSIHEVMEDNGFLVDTHDAKAFSLSLQQLVDDSQLRERCARNSRRLASRFSLRASMAQYEAIIVEELSAKTRLDRRN